MQFLQANFGGLRNFFIQVYRILAKRAEFDLPSFYKLIKLLVNFRISFLRTGISITKFRSGELRFGNASMVQMWRSIQSIIIADRIGLEESGGSVIVVAGTVTPQTVTDDCFDDFWGNRKRHHDVYLNWTFCPILTHLWTKFITSPAFYRFLQAGKDYG